ncbi:MAG: hypothetical protein CVT74_17265, partial [Alphaproteobacteria bacterium HGW-Alphaproteobacteria-13]
MAVKVAINGFGRIGRMVARAILERPDCGLELVAINDLADAKANALLFKRDSVHGPFPGDVSVDGDTMTVNGKPAKGQIEGRTLLVDFLRDTLNLTGTHVGCDTSQCGACVVHVDGRAVKACTMFAAEAEGA